jgi:manganese/zinc/iron transport system permease protein
MSPFDLRPDDWWIIATAVFCNVACALVGCFLVLRGLSLMGDAISHAVLPGLAVAFLLTHSRASAPMLAGAAVVGMLTAFLTGVLHRWGKVTEDASMGVVFTSLFALGVVLITRAAEHVDLDPGCVLYGLIEYVPLDTHAVFGFEIPRATMMLAVVMLALLALITLFYKELKIVCFDPALATAMGINATVMHYGLMAAVAVTTVASFESVGSILVVAMLIAPGATAHLLTDRLKWMLVLAAVSGVVSAFVGYLLALHWNTAVAGMISVVAGAQFALAVFFAPRHGYLSKVFHQAALSLRIVREDILGILYRWHESGRPTPLTAPDVIEAVKGGRLAAIALRQLLLRKLIIRDPAGGLQLTAPGQSDARSLVRSHRLWESYLARHTDLPADHLHEPAERMEHFVTPGIEADLMRDLGDASDPHGREIPPKLAE